VRRLGIAAALVLVLLAALLVIVHTPPVRNAVLRRAVAELESRFNLALTAERIDYNLIRLRVTLGGVRLAAAGMTAEPFLTAGEAEVTLPRSALLGPFALESVRLENVRVAIVRRADGTTNLPTTEGGEGGEPAAVPIREVTIPRLSLEVTDAVDDLSFTAPLAVRMRSTGGELSLLAPGRIRRGDIETPLTALGGGVAFDGRALRVSRFAATTPEIAITADGAIALLVAEPRLDLRVAGTADVPGAARWATDAEVPTGMVGFNATVAGPFDALAAGGRITSDALVWQGLPVSTVSGDLAVDGTRLSLSRLAATLAGGRVSLAGMTQFATQDARVSANWVGLELDTLTRTLAPDLAVYPAGRGTGTATARGTLTALATWSAEVRNDTAPTDPAPSQLAVSGRTELRLARGDWAVDADQTVAGAPLRVALGGRLDVGDLRRSTVMGTATTTDADLPALLAALRHAGLVAAGDDLLSSGRFDAEALVSGRLASPALDLKGRATDVAGQGVSNVSADVGATGTLDRMDLTAQVRQGAVNELQATGAVQFGERTVTARITGRLGDPAALAGDLPVGGIVELTLDGGGRFDALTARGTVTVADARYDTTSLGRIDSTVELDTAAARVTATIAELSARLNARVTLDAPRTAALDLAVEDGDLVRLLRDADLGIPVTGRVSLTAQGSAPLADWRAGTGAVEISRLDARARDLPIRLLAPARAAYGGDAVEVSALEATAGNLRLSASGRLARLIGSAAIPEAEALRVEVVGDLGEVMSAATAAGLVARPDVSGSGPVALLARVTGSVERPILAGDLELSGGSLATADLPAASGVTLRAHAGDGWLDLIAASAEWQGSFVRANGRMPLRLLDAYIPGDLVAAQQADGLASLTATATGITPRVLAPFLDAATVEQIEGAIDLSARLESPSLELADLQGAVTVDRFEVRLAGLPVQQRQPTQIAFGDGFARVTTWDWTGQGAELGVRGQVRLADRQTAVLANGRVDLRLLTPFVRGTGVALSGLLEPRLSITGVLDNPRLDGDVSLSLGEIRLSDPQIVATELNARAVLSRTTAFITELTGAVNGGTLTGGGEVTLGAGGIPSSSLTATLRGVAVEFPEGLRSELGADLTLALSAPTPSSPLSGRLSGDVTIVDSAYREPIVVVTSLLAALQNQQLTAGAGDDDSFLTRLALDLRVVTENDVVVDNNVARLQLGADLRVIGTGAVPALSGRADLREGGQLYFGRNIYTIESGSIGFQNPEIIEPNLNIRALTRAGGEEIELTLTGTPGTLDVQLRSPSNPDLSEPDLGSLLITGRTLSEVPSAQAQIVGEQVLGYLSGDVLGLAGRAVGLDTLRLGGTDESLLRRDPTLVATETDPTSRLTVGRRLGRLEVTLSQSLREGDGQTWIVDYLAARRLNLRFVSRDNDLRAYEFRHEVTLGSVPSAAAGAPRDRVEERVVAVTFSGDLVLPEARLRDELDIEPGDLFDFAEWQRGRERLEVLYQAEGYREARITERRVEGGGGVSLTFDVAPGPPTSIAVAGYRLRDETLRALHEAWVQSIFDDFLIAEAEGVVRAALADDGFLQPTVTVSMANPGEKVLNIVVDPGPATLRRRIAVAASDPALADGIEERIERGPFAEGAWRDPAPLRQDLLRYLQGLGRLQAEVTTAPPAVVDGEAVLTVSVNAGPLFTLDEARVDGASAQAPVAVFEPGRLDPGTPYEAAGVEAERLRLVAAYREAGFTAARVTASASVNDETRAVSVVFTAEEGPRQVLREIVVDGNAGIDTDVVTRALDLDLGEPLGGDAWLQARTRVFDTGLFQRVDVAVESTTEVQPTDPEQPVRVRVSVREWPALRLRYGFRLAEERPLDDIEGRDITPGLSADITRRTLFGRAVSVGGAVDYRRRYRLGRVFAGAPTLMGLPIESVVTLERSREDRESVTLVTDHSGVSWEQRLRVMRNLRLSYSYAFDRDHTFDTAPPAPGIPGFDILVNVARLTGAAIYDTRDDPADTFTGSLFTANIEHGAEKLGSDIRFLRYLSQAYHFRSWRGLVFGSAVRIGLARGLGGQDLIPSERFYAGGARSVRGMAEDALGPVDFLGFATGGGGLLLLNQEVRFPIYGWLRGVGFVDAGNVFTTPRDVSLADLRGSAGAGLRLATPVGLLRVDYARLWAPRGDERPARWTLGIGHTF
jgi:outer membrane protein assembly factor BamA